MTVSQSGHGPSVPMTGRTRYDSGAMALHWLIALAVLLNIGLGLYMGDLPRSDPMKFQIVQLHKSIGLTVLMLSLLRVAWRLTHTIPALPAEMGAPVKALARTVQVLLYLLMIVLPLTGWLMVSSSPLGLPTSYFGLFDWPHIWFLADMARESKKELVEVFEESHETLAWIAIGLIGLHVVGALYHQHVRRDGVLKSMLPGK